MHNRLRLPAAGASGSRILESNISFEDGEKELEVKKAEEEEEEREREPGEQATALRSVSAKL